MKNSDTFTIKPKGEREIEVSRRFDAPRKLVFEAFTKPDLVKRWLGPMRGWAMDVCEIDLKPGGRYRYIWRRDNSEMIVTGTYREVAPPDKIVHTEQFEKPWYEGEAVITTTFVESNGQTTVTMTMLHQSQASRDAVLKSGMELGMMETYDQLEALLAA